MKLCLRIAALLFLVSGTLAQDLDLFDALDDSDPTPAKPKEKPKAPEKPGSDDGLDLFDALGPDPTPKPDKPAVVPPKSGGGDELDLLDAFGPDPNPKPKPPKSGGGDDSGFDLGDALGPDPNPKPDKPAVKPPRGGGGGGSFDDSDLLEVGGGDYKPDGGHSGGHGGGAGHGGYDTNSGGADQPQEGGSGPIAGIVSAVGVALLGAASSYFAYQKKKLCFKLQGGADPESGKGHHGTRSDPQVFSNLLRTS